MNKIRKLILTISSVSALCCFFSFSGINAMEEDENENNIIIQQDEDEKQDCENLNIISDNLDNNINCSTKINTTEETKEKNENSIILKDENKNKNNIIIQQNEDKKQNHEKFNLKDLNLKNFKTPRKWRILNRFKIYNNGIKNSKLLNAIKLQPSVKNSRHIKAIYDFILFSTNHDLDYKGEKDKKFFYDFYNSCFHTNQDCPFNPELKSISSYNYTKNFNRYNKYKEFVKSIKDPGFKNTVSFKLTCLSIIKIAIENLLYKFERVNKTSYDILKNMLYNNFALNTTLINGKYWNTIINESNFFNDLLKDLPPEKLVENCNPQELQIKNISLNEATDAMGYIKASFGVAFPKILEWDNSTKNFKLKPEREKELARIIYSKNKDVDITDFFYALILKEINKVLKMLKEENTDFWLNPEVIYYLFGNINDDDKDKKQDPKNLKTFLDDLGENFKISENTPLINTVNMQPDIDDDVEDPEFIKAIHNFIPFLKNCNSDYEMEKKRKMAHDFYNKYFCKNKNFLFDPNLKSISLHDSYTKNFKRYNEYKNFINKLTKSLETKDPEKNVLLRQTYLNILKTAIKNLTYKFDKFGNKIIYNILNDNFAFNEMIGSDFLWMSTKSPAKLLNELEQNYNSKELLNNFDINDFELCKSDKDKNIKEIIDYLDNIKSSFGKAIPEFLEWDDTIKRYKLKPERKKELEEIVFSKKHKYMNIKDVFHAIILIEMDRILKMLEKENLNFLFNPKLLYYLFGNAAINNLNI